MEVETQKTEMVSPAMPEVLVDFMGLLKLYSDGSVFRSNEIKHENSIHDDGYAIWKDCLFDPKHSLYLRLYKPRNHSSLDNGSKLPIICYLHAGGFCFGSRSFPNFHNSCLTLCSKLQVMIVAPDYRLAPEHRLPAAIEDAHTALKWLQGQASSENRDEWLQSGVDFNRLFVFGDSSGGNIAHHLAVKIEPGSPELSPVRIRGYVLLSPFFGGVVRTKFEEERPCEKFWTQELYDKFWRLAVPIGANVDHPLVNPFGPTSPSLEAVNFDPILLLAGADEILKDRIEDYAKRLEEFKKPIDYIAFEGKQHGFFTSNSFKEEEAKGVVEAVKHFMSKCSY